MPMIGAEWRDTFKSRESEQHLSRSYGAKPILKHVQSIRHCRIIILEVTLEDLHFRFFLQYFSRISKASTLLFAPWTFLESCFTDV